MTYTCKYDLWKTRFDVVYWYIAVTFSLGKDFVNINF